MWSLIILFLLSQVCLKHSAVLDDLVEAQLRDYDSQYRILQQLLAKECPGESIDKREEPGLLKLKLQVRILQVRNLREKLTKCQKEKMAATEPTTSTKPIQYPSSCPSYDGNTQLDIQLVSYNNPSNKKVFGKPCNADGSPCRIFFEICVSPLNSLSCEFRYLVTDVVGSKSSINLIGTSGSQLNPLKIDLGNRKWEGVRVSFTALHKSASNRLSGNNVVDEFDYNVTIPQGTNKVEHLHGKRPVDQSELIVLFAVPCATSTTSAPTTTPTTTLATTTPIVNASATTTLTTTSATTTPIANTSATTTPIANESATTTPIANASATTTPIANASATTTPIANVSATTTPISNASATTTPIANVSATTSPIANVSATTTPIANVSATTTPIANASATTTPIANVSATTTPIANVSATTTPIANASATTTPIANVSATTTPIANASATTTPISNASATTTPIANVSATTTPIANVSATTTPISNASATTTPISNASATTTPISNASATTTPIANASATTTPIANASATTTPISNASATTTPIANASATTTPISNASATTTPIANASATTTPIANASATTTPISNASATTTPISNASATTTPIANASATTKPTTNAFPIPSECKTATNLTQYWRQNHDGEGILGGGSHAHPEGHACDLHEDLIWFRFTGAAGTHMLDTCPKAKSCGTSHPIWTDAAYPQATGVEAEISAHVITEVNCKYWTLPMLVMRCSLDKENDFIYQYIGNKFSSCTFAFCGTN